MMAIFMALAATLCIFDIRDMKKKKQYREIVVYCAAMLMAAAFGAIYLSDTFRPGVSSYILDFFGVKR